MPYKNPADQKRWRDAHREQAAIYAREYRKNNRARINHLSREWVVQNHEKRKEVVRRYQISEKGKATRLAANRRWRAENPDKVKEQNRLRQIRHPEWGAIYINRRRARKLSNGFEKYSRAAVIARDRSVCHICHRKVAKKNMTLDHLIPISKGGPDTFDNVAVAHRRCNLERYTGKIPAQLFLMVG